MMTRSSWYFFAAAVCMTAWQSIAVAQTAATVAGTYTPKVGQPGKDVMWMPTPQELVDRMLDAVDLQPDDYLVDLGSGDGRTVITAAKRGARAHGIEYNADMVALSRRNAQAAGVADRATFEQGDIFETDFSKATVLTLFLLPDLNIRLRPTILDMKPGTRVVSNSFAMEEWQPDELLRGHKGCKGFCTAFKWIVPAKVEGTWNLGDQKLVLNQSFQKIEGMLNGTDKGVPVSGRLAGAQITFTVGGVAYDGRVDGDTMSGMADGKRPWSARRSAG
jgi:precorrin-6B methylase 2